MTPTGVIGRDGDMPWRLSSDLRRFKRLTMGGVLIMGRRTYDSIGRPLPGRRTIVVTRSQDWSAEGVDRAASPQAALEMAGNQRTFVVGGAEIYRQLLPRCTHLYLTRVWSDVEGDTKLEIDLSDFRVIEQTRFPASARDDVPTEFLRLVRRDSCEK
jgi:dihydrofolate reductase